MSAVIKCDGCGTVIEYKKATHVRTYKMSSVTSYHSNDVKHVAEICPECNEKLCKLLGKVVR